MAQEGKTGARVVERQFKNQRKRIVFNVGKRSTTLFDIVEARTATCRTDVRKYLHAHECKSRDTCADFKNRSWNMIEELRLINRFD